MIKRFMKGIFNKRPSLPKYTSIWNPDIVLRHLKSLGKDLHLQQLTYKTVMLLSLLTAQRCQFIHMLKISDLHFSEDHVEINTSELMKQSRPGFHLGPITLQQYSQDRDLCIVQCLKEYLDQTKDLRTDDKLFISMQAPHKGVTCGTIARWIKLVLKDAGININTFSAHSTRAAAASRANSKGLQLGTILKAIGWSQNSTFRKFYNKPVETSSEIQKCLLGLTD
ncbi:MAG: tyrosine-type recombinase/integrase [Candidatus Thiodiazotropha sp.]